MSKRQAKPSTAKSPKPVLAMTSREARAFFLKPESYSNIDFPHYIRFDGLLKAVSKGLGQRSHKGLGGKPGEHEDLNYALLTNKDGRYAWRPLQLIHPVVYVALVNAMTAKSAWKIIRDRFKQLQADPRSRCLSIPLQSQSRRKDKAAQILNWWQEVEQASIESGLDYSYAFHADVSDCYPSIYTHSIAWAVHGKKEAKDNKGDPKYIGNVIDGIIQDMQHRQTNGIPQGSVLMDFIAEMVLGYADMLLAERMKAANTLGYRILRYRDDYRIFVSSPQTGEAVLKALTEVLIGLGLKLGAGKTTGGLPVVRSSVKADKLAWAASRQFDKDPAKHLLLIHAHGVQHPNSGSLRKALNDYHARLTRISGAIRNPKVLISIAVDIGYNNPKAFDVCAGIVSRLLVELPSDADRVETIQKIEGKIERLPNVGHLEVWLQRISHPYAPDAEYSEPLCKLVQGEMVPLWNSDWIADKNLLPTLDSSQIIDTVALAKLAKVVKPSEINVFLYE